MRDGGAPRRASRDHGEPQRRACEPPAATPQRTLAAAAAPRRRGCLQAHAAGSPALRLTLRAHPAGSHALQACPQAHAAGSLCGRTHAAGSHVLQAHAAAPMLQRQLVRRRPSPPPLLRAGRVVVCRWQNCRPTAGTALRLVSCRPSHPHHATPPIGPLTIISRLSLIVCTIKPPSPSPLAALPRRMTRLVWPLPHPVNEQRGVPSPDSDTQMKDLGRVITCPARCETVMLVRCECGGRLQWIESNARKHREGPGRKTSITGNERRAEPERRQTGGRPDIISLRDMTRGANQSANPEH